MDLHLGEGNLHTPFIRGHSRLLTPPDADNQFNILIDSYLQITNHFHTIYAYEDYYCSSKLIFLMEMSPILESSANLLNLGKTGTIMPGQGTTFSWHFLTKPL